MSSLTKYDIQQPRPEFQLMTSAGGIMVLGNLQDSDHPSAPPTRPTGGTILWHVCWKPGLRSQQGQPLLRNNSANMPVARQAQYVMWWQARLHTIDHIIPHHAKSPNTSPTARERHNKHLCVTAVMSCNKRSTVVSGVLWVVHPEAMSQESTRQANQSWDGGVRRVGGWCEMATSLWGHGPQIKGMSVAGRRYTVGQWRPLLGTLVCGW
jgi:hypothetical protein